MTNEEVYKTKQIYIKLSAYYQRPIDDAILVMYCEDLADLPFDRVELAFQNYRRDPKNTNLPLPAKLRAMVEPNHDTDALAIEAASRIVRAVSKFGYPSPGEAREFIGELGWRVVERTGGWGYVCENLGTEISLTTFQAQARDLCRATINIAKTGMDNMPIAIDKRGNDLLQKLPQMRSLE